MTEVSFSTNSQAPKREHDDKNQRQRVVILPGPHKTATTSVQSFLVRLQKKDKLGDFEWPAAQSKAFAPVMKSVLFNVDDEMGVRGRKQEKIHKAWKKGKSIVVGAEILDYVAALTPLEAKPAFERLLNLFPIDVVPETDMSVIVMYRTPRASHLVSAWKQNIAMAMKSPPKTNKPWRTVLEERFKSEPPPLSEWLCTGRWEGRIDFDVEKIIAAQINPMGVADAFVRYGNMTATMGDMSNIHDVPSTVVCEVLKIQCTDEGTVKKVEPKVLNQRSNPTELGMDETDMENVEEILRRMDCFYYCNGLKDKLTVLHAQDEMFTDNMGWNKCCESPKYFLDPLSAYRELKSLGCRASGLGDVSKTNSSLAKGKNYGKKEDTSKVELSNGKKDKMQVGLLDQTLENAVSDDIARKSGLTERDITMYVQADRLLFPGYLVTIIFLVVSAGFIQFRKQRSKYNRKQENLPLAVVFGEFVPKTVTSP